MIGSRGVEVGRGGVKAESSVAHVNEERAEENRRTQCIRRDFGVVWE